MISLLPKKLFLLILFGLVFFLGGAGAASAAPMPNQWAFKYKMVPSWFVKTDAWFSGASAPEISNLIKSYSTQPECSTEQSGWASDSTYTITKSCYEITIKDLQAAQALAQQNLQNANFSGDPLLENLHCGVPFIGLDNHVEDCVPILVYYVIYKPASYLLMGAGYLFDKILSLSIEGVLVAPPFIDSTWLVVRDFSNMLFIFILIYTGVQTILGFGDWRKTVLNVVIMALLINFSLFFTKVVIDAGNILAVGIKNSINPGHSLSEGLVGSFEPQQFLNMAGKVPALDATAVFIIASVVSGFAAYIFFKVAILFSRRLVVFWGLMIISPFAFVSIALPGKANKFQEWLGELVGQAFVAPVFLFFIYVIMKVISGGSGILGGFSDGGGWLKAIIGSIVIATLLIKALQEALKATEDMAGTTGEAFSGLVAGAMGMATSGVAGVGRKAIGGGAALALQKGWVSSDSKIGGYANALTKSSFDVRNLGGKDSMFGATIGGGIAKGVGSLGVGKGGGVGGAAKAEEERVKKATDHVPKMSIFEEQGARDRVAKEAAKRQTGENISSASATFGAKLVKEQTAQLEADVKTAQEKHDESETAKEVEKTKVAYEESVRDVMRGGSPTARDVAKAAFDRATKAHSTSGTSVALQKTLDDLREAKKVEQEGATAPVSAEKQMVKESKAEDPVAAENDRRRKAYADKVEKGGWFGIGANPVAAEKIRKGEESGHAKKGKELAAELKKEKEGKARSEVIEQIEEKIEEHKGNK